MSEDTPTPSEPTGQEPTTPESLSQQDLFERVLTPIANPTDGQETARAVRAYLPETTIYVAHVVQKGEGVPDKAGVEQRLAFAERTYEAFFEELDRTTTSPATASAPSATPVTLVGSRSRDALTRWTNCISLRTKADVCPDRRPR